MRINIIPLTTGFIRPAGAQILYGSETGRPANPVGKTFADDSEMGFEEYVGDVLLMRDYRPGKWDDELEEFPEISDSGICLTFVSTDRPRPRDAKYLHIFLTRKIIPGQRPFEVMDELYIDRKSHYEYIHEDVRYESAVGNFTIPPLYATTPKRTPS